MQNQPPGTLRAQMGDVDRKLFAGRTPGIEFKGFKNGASPFGRLLEPASRGSMIR